MTGVLEAGTLRRIDDAEQRIERLEERIADICKWSVESTKVIEDGSADFEQRIQALEERAGLRADSLTAKANATMSPPDGAHRK